MTYTGISISGKAGAGKNAFAQVLAAQLAQRGEWGTEVAFATALKQQLWEQYGLRKEDPGGREKLLEIGVRTEESSTRLVQILADRVAGLLPYGVIPIITDCRYLNELEWCRQSGFVTVRIDATVLDRSVVLSRRGEDVALASSDHDSETELDEESFHVRFSNPHGSLSILHEAAPYVIELLLGEAELAA